MIDGDSMMWPDVVLALAEQSTSKPEWYVSVNAHLRVNLRSWTNKNHREQLKEFIGSAWGVSDEEMAMIGNDPEDLQTTLDDFIAESVNAIASLLKLLELKLMENKQTDTPDQVSIAKTNDVQKKRRGRLSKEEKRQLQTSALA